MSSCATCNRRNNECTQLLSQQFYKHVLGHVDHDDVGHEEWKENLEHMSSRPSRNRESYRTHVVSQ